MTGKGPSIRAVVVEDSAAEAAHITRIVQAEGDIVVVGHARTGAQAIDLTRSLRPDIVTIELDLPDGSAQHAIEQVMARTPTPILVLSGNTADRRSPSVVEALVAGALDALPKPTRWTAEREAELRASLRRLRKVQVIRHPRGALTTISRVQSRLEPVYRYPVVAVAASTGGPSALAILLSGLGGLAAPVLVVQHLHPDFTAGLIEWMSRVSALPVEVAVHGQELRPGHVYVGAGGTHVRIGANFRVVLDELPVTVHRPSADELFKSVAEHAGPAGIGVLMTGMGDDGARGLLAIHRSGGQTLAQDEASSAVFGMPAVALRLGAVTELLPPAQLAEAIKRASRKVQR